MTTTAIQTTCGGIAIVAVLATLGAPRASK